MTEFILDGTAVQAASGETVLQAALSAGIEITRLCSDPMLEVTGKCGLCLIEIEGEKELSLACETPVREGMKVSTDSAAVRAAVKAAAEKLLASHPADCAVCSKTGDCRIQNICVKYKPDLSLSGKASKKRKLLDWLQCVDEKCIKCGRCVAFLDKAGVKNAQMPPLSCPPFPFSATLADICPAAALTETASREVLRSREMKRVQSIDVTDCVCAKIDLGIAKGRIVRAMPAGKRTVISDKARFCMEGLNVSRLTSPLRRVNGLLEECSWSQALATVAEKMNAVPADRMAGLIGDYADCESMLALSDLFALKNAKAIDARPDEEMRFDLKNRQSWLFNTPFSQICKADGLLCIGADTDKLAPAVSWRLRQNPMSKMFIGKMPELSSQFELLSETPLVLEDILNGLGRGASLLRQSRYPMIIVGQTVWQRPDAAAIMDLVYKIASTYEVIREDWNGYDFLTDKVSLLGALELGVMSETPLEPKIRRGDFDFIYLLNKDSFRHSDAPETFVVYQGIYNSEAAQDADVVLPALSFAEKKATYVNMRGKAQSTAVALPPVGQSKEDWKILRALSDFLGTAPLPYDDLEEIRDGLAGKSVIFYEREKSHPAENKAFGTAGTLSDTPISSRIDSFSDELSKHSETAKILRWRSL